MKISIGMKLQSGPFGGGNQAMRALSAFLAERDVMVSHDLADPALDLIMLTDPRAELRSCAYTDKEILRYLRFTNPRALVLHRINECDERKGTTGVNALLTRANRCADHTVFVSAWIRDLFLHKGIPCGNVSVIRNGSDNRTFHSAGYQRWDGKEPLRLITHHWGANWMKGFDIYQRLDEMLGEERYAGKIEFSYAGNLPEGFHADQFDQFPSAESLLAKDSHFPVVLGRYDKDMFRSSQRMFRNAQYIAPTHGHDLAAVLRRHHVYVTASQNEPGSNHQNEGALCGLPLLYLESGSLPDYCSDYGIPFTPDNFEDKLSEMMANYGHWADRMKDYPHTATRMAEAYYDLFRQLMAQRDAILRRRSKLRLWGSWLKSMIFARDE